MARATTKAAKRTRPKAVEREIRRNAEAADAGLRQRAGLPDLAGHARRRLRLHVGAGRSWFDPAKVVYDENGLVVSDGNTLPPRSVADETRNALRNLEAALKEAGCTLDDVVDASVWLRDPRDFHEMNKAYGEFFKRNQPDALDLPHRLHVRLPRRDQGDRLQAARGGKAHSCKGGSARGTRRQAQGLKRHPTPGCPVLKNSRNARFQGLFFWLRGLATNETLGSGPSRASDRRHAASLGFGKSAFSALPLLN